MDRHVDSAVGTVSGSLYRDLVHFVFLKGPYLKDITKKLMTYYMILIYLFN